MLKISPESLIKGQDVNRFDTLNKILNHEYNTEDIKAKNYAVAANGAVFDQSIEGVLPETMKYLMEERNSVKSTMKDKDRQLQKIKTILADDNKNIDSDYEGKSKEELEHIASELEDEIAMLDATQLALKILANSKNLLPY